MNSCWQPAVLDLLAGVVRCPDDYDEFFSDGPRLICRSCHREIAASVDGIVELLPLHPVSHGDITNERYMQTYYDQFSSKCCSDQRAWGAEENVPESWSKLRVRQVRRIYPLISGKQLRVLCDFSAGAGLYTLAYAKYFDVVLHCDLSMSALRYVSEKARTIGIDNLIPIRADYFSPPFRNSLDVVLCLDSLIRGKDHELRLLRSIRGSLAPNGIAVVDFHNWWHNPLRRLGLLKDNFKGNQSYSRPSADLLLKEAGIAQFDYFPFWQEWDPEGLAVQVCGPIIPPTRLIYRFRSSSGQLISSPVFQ